MSWFVVQADEAEVVELPGGGAFRLLADGRDTGGALGANRLALGAGADGARTHFHARSSETFFVVSGVVEFFLDGKLTSVGAGGMVVIPPGVPHAFGAAPGSAADLFAVLTPGVDRFEYFRTLGRVQRGEESFDTLLPEQDRFDVHFLDATAWREARGR
ncbi:cupin domain-containing protein [Nonomuraea sp. NPDC050536]|uniref:cupin domain-containing protein n=1 Tax=Nonomuraea sp. NPDC050536 TaxID=3364366 RepID=UPI0037C7A350